MVQNVLTADDFDRILDNYAGRQVSHTPVTQTTSNISGEETLTEGTTASIKAYFMKTGQNWDFAKLGFMEKGDAVMLAKISDAVVKNDKIILHGESFRVKEAFGVPGVFDSTGTGSIYVYTACNLFFVENIACTFDVGKFDVCVFG